MLLGDLTRASCTKAVLLAADDIERGIFATFILDHQRFVEVGNLLAIFVIDLQSLPRIVVLTTGFIRRCFVLFKVFNLCELD